MSTHVQDDRDCTIENNREPTTLASLVTVQPFKFTTFVEQGQMSNVEGEYIVGQAILVECTWESRAVPMYTFSRSCAII